MKRFVVAMLVVFGMSAPRSARADLFGGDVAVLASILAQIIQTYQQIKQQLDTAKMHVRYVEQNIKSLDPTSFNQLLALYNEGRYTYDSIVGDAQALGFRIDSLNHDFRKLFPAERDFKNVRYSDYDVMYSRWQNELQTSAQIAMRAQANAAQLEENARATTSLLVASRSADGEVRQLQTVVQMLSVVQSQLTTLTQTISAAERVNSNMAAAAASEKLMEREARRRRRTNYTSRGAPVPVHRRLP
jgi:type IV secretion system protein TrbJ